MVAIGKPNLRKRLWWILGALVIYLFVYYGRKGLFVRPEDIPSDEVLLDYPEYVAKSVCKDLNNTANSFLSLKPALSIIRAYDISQPIDDQLKLLAVLNAEVNASVLCQVGFNPSVVLAQLALHPGASVFSFHPFVDEKDRKLAAKIAVNNSLYVPVIGNPMHTVRALAREFGPNGYALGPNPVLELIMNGRKSSANLAFNNATGITCDIIHFEEGTYEELLVMALLSSNSTSIIYNKKSGTQSELWKKGLQNGIVVSSCPEEPSADVHVGRYVYPYGAERDDDKKPTHDISDLIQEFRASLHEVLASVAGEDKMVVWIPVGQALQGLANNLYCSLVKHNVTNYIFFAHDQQSHEYARAHNRASFFSSLWFTPIEGKQIFHWFNYNVVMRERFAILLDIIELGYDVLLNDADAYWVTNLLPDLASPHDIVAQEDAVSADPAALSQVCGGFVLFKSRPAVKEFFHVMQQLAFLFPELEDQEIGNMIYKSNFTCLIRFNSNLANSCPLNTHSLVLQYKDPRVYTSGHFYCNNHVNWAKENVVPKLIHMNGVANKETCVQSSKHWGYEMSNSCTHSKRTP